MQSKAELTKADAKATAKDLLTQIQADQANLKAYAKSSQMIYQI